ncbi:F-box/LRR-repeat protein At3g26922-like [Panicum hallii]|uniref:F-box/LRR-repeat protein At3g26922-like n=1 Tax=Panicum hallii TaxID=206008 RepID=UPI000DF4CC5E|nr:F-box/LRR-repeat protein At3g26922-like [Panicum hallii]
MPRGSKAARNASPPGPGRGGDRISALPDAVLQHALGFLPVREAVRTCVLARRWRHLWRSLPCLRIVDVEVLGSVNELTRFVNRILLLRDPGSALDGCEFDLRGFEYVDPVSVDLWIRHALLLRARVLSLSVRWTPLYKPFDSQYLSTLHLNGVQLSHNALDCSSCPMLEDLEITLSDIYAREICSPFSKRLSIVNCKFCLDHVYSTRISAPSLIWLKLEYCSGAPPLLEGMASLESACIRFGCGVDDFRMEGCYADCCGECVFLYDYGVQIDGRVLLQGLSNASTLEFRASFGMFTLEKDLVCCPTFSNLKTFYLINWCLAGDFRALLGFLRCTPNLEKLSLQLCQKEKCVLKMEDSNPIGQSFSLGKLKIVEVKCEKIDERVQRTLKILSSIGTCLEEFNIQKI